MININTNSSTIVTINKMEGKEIIGILLIKNEELFIVNVLNSILDFCDKIIVADNCSTDHTAEKVSQFQSKNDKVTYYKIKNPSVSHDLISDFAGGNVWVFAVDGDELYDPRGLSFLRGDILEGKFDDYWMVLGNVLNCVELDSEKQCAKGYLAPPCRSMTKLYNFSVIKQWSGPCPERLHGGEIIFKSGFTSKKRYYLHNDFDWDDSIFRCLHLCFLPRTSEEVKETMQLNIRKNIVDILSESLWAKLRSGVFRLVGEKQSSPWKKEKYMRGDLVTKNINNFPLNRPMGRGKDF